MPNGLWRVVLSHHPRYYREHERSGSGLVFCQLLVRSQKAGSAPDMLSTVLTKILLKKRKEYYQQLGLASKTLDLTSWLLWFANIALEDYMYIDFIIKKSVILREAEGKINPRQEKVLLRLFHAGPEGVVGGLSAKNYMSITNATIATTTRDLNDLVKKIFSKELVSLKRLVIF
ncbi:TPA: hypothetical protein JBG74_12730 [Legionella pneumophila]|uniref:Uncharacterized protein n=4 Tax=Legionella pneumophila TaxID=446 RepID=Q5ZWJ5_LEGPH|nr:hypothetical protein [Legionella pneumophila]AAU27176.1 hypothetical protein lpg1090 [Legionella pneumophila subsp. pneumophila str. Philadelphia 1]AEW51335.1 hypothetical protein lp12_1067 [Legionella pneumophila subsp. pneumophila ATCC 43290]AOU07115.1 hypothetical protein A9E98_05390 [Legionella pneumophila]AOU10117.1 hypothetical protein A9F03_05575 [Legionella pneumophila]AOU13040.1 hypothetical protein A9E99_05395 [Legionella pneumophila]